MTDTIALGAAPLDWTQIRRILTGGVAVSLAPEAVPRIAAARAVVERLAAGDAAVYGINTGFGRLAQQRIKASDLAVLQRNLILSHAAGVGAPLADEVVRLVLALKAASLAAGASGVRPSLVEALLALHRADVLPVIPSQGSVGASGDLAPLAHMAAALLGIGEVRVGGAAMPAAEGLARAGLAPVELAAKEGLALINGTQVSTALALAGLARIERAFGAAIVAGAMAVEAVRGSHRPFDARIHALRGQRGQIDVAAAFRVLLAGSELNASHQGPHCDRVQDPYSLRCQPQVMGAVLDSLRHAASVLTIEANGVTDNPLVLMDPEDIVSGGNFHAEPVAIASDLLAIAAAEVGALSERRVAMLIDTSISGLPPFLTADAGLNSGFMLAHVTAAALASENKSLAHPASVDSLPTSANQEDHVSMATFAARRLTPLAENVTHIVAIELLAAAQGLDFQRPLRSSAPVEAAYDAIRERVAFRERDRLFAPDIAAVAGLVMQGVPIGLSGSLALDRPRVAI
jgi:histidine ammonia-lyase